MNKKSTQSSNEKKEKILNIDTKNKLDLEIAKTNKFTYTHYKTHSQYTLYTYTALTTNWHSHTLEHWVSMCIFEQNELSYSDATFWSNVITGYGPYAFFVLKLYKSNIIFNLIEFHAFSACLWSQEKITWIWNFIQEIAHVPYLLPHTLHTQTTETLYAYNCITNSFIYYH